MTQEKVVLKEGVSAVTAIDDLLAYAHRHRASDIHIDPNETRVDVRVRVDGVLLWVAELPLKLHQTLVSRIKILGGLRTDEHQSAHDGRFKMLVEGKAIHVRISICPTYYGENIVLRLLADHAEGASLPRLGFSKANLAAIESQLRSSSGMILATGPTGSGKTTTLYALLQSVATPELSVITIEDPVEYALAGVRQIQVNPQTGLTFAAGLRSVLRQDPDVIMVGEIRDRTTATVAVNTALTGHMLLSTLHTSDAATTLPRLLDMRVEPYLIASTVRMAIGQRLVRTICSGCKRERPVTELERRAIGAISGSSVLEKVSFGEGCERCFRSGFFGRAVVAEVLIVTDPIREAIMRRDSARVIKGIAIKEGMRPLILDGLDKVAAGITTLEEVFRVIHEA